MSRQNMPEYALLTKKSQSCYTLNAKTEFFLGKEEIFLRLTDTLATEFKLDPASISPTTHLFDDLQLDSLDVIELVASLKDYTNGEIDPSVYQDLKTVQDLVDMLQPFWKAAQER
jgi:acyl carrier protein